MEIIVAKLSKEDRKAIKRINAEIDLEKIRSLNEAEKSRTIRRLKRRYGSAREYKRHISAIRTYLVDKPISIFLQECVRGNGIKVMNDYAAILALAEAAKIEFPFFYPIGAKGFAPSIHEIESGARLHALIAILDRVPRDTWASLIDAVLD